MWFWKAQTVQAKYEQFACLAFSTYTASHNSLCRPQSAFIEMTIPCRKMDLHRWTLPTCSARRISFTPEIKLSDFISEAGWNLRSWERRSKDQENCVDLTSRFCRVLADLADIRASTIPVDPNRTLTTMYSLFMWRQSQLDSSILDGAQGFTDRITVDLGRPSVDSI